MEQKRYYFLIKNHLQSDDSGHLRYDFGHFLKSLLCFMSIQKKSLEFEVYFWPREPTNLDSSLKKFDNPN